MASRSYCHTLQGAHCHRWRRVGRRRLLRCAKFKLPKACRLKAGYRDGHVPHNTGRVCKKRKSFFSPYLNKKVLRCVKYEGSAGSSGRGANGGNGAANGRSLFSFLAPSPPKPKPARRPYDDEIEPFVRSTKPPIYVNWPKVVVPGYIPIMSIPALEKTQAGLTPVRRR